MERQSQAKSAGTPFPLYQFFHHPRLDYSRFLFLHSGTLSGAAPHRYPALGGFGSLREITISAAHQLPSLDDFIRKNRGNWIFGHISYDAGYLTEPVFKNHLISNEPFPPLTLFVPANVLLPEKDHFILLDQQEKTIQPFGNFPLEQHHDLPNTFTEDRHFTHGEYIDRLKKIQQHLRRGDIYEMNYCIPFSASGRFSDPTMAWVEMQRQQQAPFGALYRHQHHWLMCCSPERWLSRNGQQLLSQPIKGTARRDSDPQRDQEIAAALCSSEKERAENVMIVDLVRNDLGRIAATGSVTVEELFGLYTFPAVHQLISTISATQMPGTSFTEILQALFPMGSMTGAPKISAMQIIAQQETFSRNLYSGSVGYIDPEGNFDFNVVIRSILYNAQHGSALFPAGSAITIHSDPEAEFRECLLKSNSMRKTMGLPLST